MDLKDALEVLGEEAAAREAAEQAAREEAEKAFVPPVGWIEVDRHAVSYVAAACAVERSPMGRLFVPPWAARLATAKVSGVRFRMAVISDVANDVALQTAVEALADGDAVDAWVSAYVVGAALPTARAPSALLAKL